jgi:hypothetical protein
MRMSGPRSRDSTNYGAAAVSVREVRPFRFASTTGCTWSTRNAAALGCLPQSAVSADATLPRESGGGKIAAMFPITINLERAAPPPSSISNAQIWLAMLGFVVTVLAVVITHYFARGRELRAHRREAIEGFYLAARELIADGTESCYTFLLAAEGKRLAKDCLAELTEKFGAAYGVGKGARPYYRVQMFVSLYFPHLRPWLKRVDGAERQVRQAMSVHASIEKGTPTRDQDTIRVLNESMMAFAMSVHELDETMGTEIARLDRTRWAKAFDHIRRLLALRRGG